MTTSRLTRRSAFASLSAAGVVGLLGPRAHSQTFIAPPGPLIGPSVGDLLHVMTFNIRFDRSSETVPGDPDHWPERAPLVKAVLQSEQPTILGVQEAQFTQLGTLRDGLGPGYDMLGYGQAGGAGGEYCAVFYDARRLVPEWWDQYWLSDTPNRISSATWGNEIPRTVTWVRFRDRQTGRRFVHLNTHFDHRSEESRRRSAKVIRAQVARSKVPVIVTGDFNADAGASPAYDILIDAPLRDTWSAAEDRLTDQIGTFPNYGPAVPSDRRIDWILTSPGVTTLSSALNAWTRVGRYPSDHIPVQALVRVG